MNLKCKRDLFDTKQTLCFKSGSIYSAEELKNDYIRVTDLTSSKRILPKSFWKEHFTIIEA